MSCYLRPDSLILFHRGRSERRAAEDKLAIAYRATLWLSAVEAVAAVYVVVFPGAPRKEAFGRIATNSKPFSFVSRPIFRRSRTRLGPRPIVFHFKALEPSINSLIKWPGESLWSTPRVIISTRTLGLPLVAFRTVLVSVYVLS